MKKILIAVLTTISGVVLLLSYRTSTQAVAPTALGGAPAGTARHDVASTPAPSSASSASSASGTRVKDGTFTGAAVRTRYGPVQVRITVSGGKVTGASAIEYPSSSGRDLAINRAAIPQLQQETVNAQSARIDMVSGATYTSDGYIGSLQSALDQEKS